MCLSMRSRLTPATPDLKVGDVVLYYRPTTTKDDAPAKWVSSWEGPYQVCEKINNKKGIKRKIPKTAKTHQYYFHDCLHILSTSRP